MGAGAARWSCARCKVSVGRLDGSTTPLPTTWSRTGASTFCLICSRALAGEAAMDSAPPACSRHERFLLRRDAVIRFEIGRTPLAPDRIIARACRTSPKKVASVRKALGDIPFHHPTAARGGV
ncbi:MAG: hypothetical protein JST08_00415 [Actinobacteria bacterium]|nr:hypothetical protein [Actinomycetota bacterium]